MNRRKDNGMEELIQSIKNSMKIKHTALDEDIRGNIESAAADLKRVGVQPYADAEQKVLKDDPLIRKAAELYCKSQADYMGKGEQFERSYEKLRDSLSLCGDYNE